MKIKTIHISNYRKICNAKINIDDNITVVAGANNSGKTSLIELLNHIIGEANSKLCVSDFPAKKCQAWCETIYPEILDIFQTQQSKKERLNKISELIAPSDDLATPILMLPIEVKIQVDYDKNNDDIRQFADYIMDFDKNSTSFYFIYKYELNSSNFSKNLDTEYEKLLLRFEKISELGLADDKDKISDLVRIIKEMLLMIYDKSSEDNVYFSDNEYKNEQDMKITDFKDLFNFYNIMAGRKLDDENSDRTQILSKQMIDIASEADDWNDLINELPDKILQPIQNAGIRESVQNTSLATLKDTMTSISQTNGTHSGNIAIDMNVTEDAIKSFLKSITCAKYQIDDYYLSESSQGLGYSNLIYIHLQIEKFKKKIDPLKVNFFVIEEPEAHMHPQMQHAFASYLFNYYDSENELQGVLTTHSHEIIRTTNNISKLRVLRQANPFQCSCFDLQEFETSIMDKKDEKKLQKLLAKKGSLDEKESQELQELESKKELLDFYDFFYTINFPDIIFADKIVMYEGDTERMYIKRLLEKEDFKLLRSQYLSYIQVGGAYAHKYEPIVSFLGIKTAIITDIDYSKDANDLNTVLQYGTTNSAINYFAEKSLNNATPTVQDLYNWQSDKSPIVVDDLICLAFQRKADQFSRTLEEAMLAKHYDISVFDTKKKDDWKQLRTNDGLKYTIPKKANSNIRDIVASTSGNKTDFMYSVIMRELAEPLCPDYIKGALIWLSK